MAARARALGKEGEIMKPALQRVLLTATLAVAVGCGTTRLTDTNRTGTEQLLISHSIDETVSNIDFRPFAGKKVFLDPQYLDGVTDKGYLISSLRQQILACGCLLQEERKNAVYVLEARAGGIGTDRDSLLVGMPQTTVPAIVPGVPGGTIPEIPLAKKTDQRGVAKIAVFAYNRKTGQPLWQSGTLEATSTLHQGWLFGAGPFVRGSLNKGTEFAGKDFEVPLIDKKTGAVREAPRIVPSTQPAYWPESLQPETPDLLVDEDKEKGSKEKATAVKRKSKDDAKVVPASHSEPAASDDSESPSESK
jgi:hypothetical protein